MTEKSKTRKTVKSSSKSVNKDELVNSIIKSKKKIKNNQKKMKDDIYVSNITEEKKKIYAPDIRPTNNLLIRIIKTKLKERNLTERELAVRFDSMGEFNNFKRALIIRDSITIEGFSKWMKVLGYDWEIVMEDTKK